MWALLAYSIKYIYSNNTGICRAKENPAAQNKLVFAVWDMILPIPIKIFWEFLSFNSVQHFWYR